MTTLTATSVGAVPRDGGAVSWAAVFAGAVGATSLSLILILLGTGLGLSVASPWASDGISGITASVGTIVWITVVQILASLMGGYLAGRLRSRWVTVHTKEVYFRDTAHGFLAWSVGTLLMATLLSSAVGTMLSTGLKAGAAVAGSAAVAGTAVAGSAVAAAPGSDSVSYSVDSLFRASPASTQPLAANRIPEATRIFAHALKSGELDTAETQYLGQLVSANTGLSQADAERRVAETFTKAKQVADDARKASAYLALWLVISLLIGAFTASLAATFGGRLRDSSVLINT